MKFTLSWLKDFLDTDASAEAIATALTSLGLEVESVSDPAAALSSFTVAEILEATPHPDADRLRVCRVKTGTDTRQIVCGAPNARAGIKVALADIGAVIPVGGFVIKASKIRGVESNGMLCSAKELGLGDDHAGIIELPADTAVGAPITQALGLNDVTIEIAVTPNRGDCLGVYGIARELAAKGLGTLKPLDTAPVPAAFPADRAIRAETSACPFFVGRTIRGVVNGESPPWLQARLKAAGLRPISALVDITNYFTLSYDRPLHVYDAAKLSGDVVARASRSGESLEALNDKQYSLPGETCVIADDAGVLGIGGIMGGRRSGCSAETRDLFLEAAWFDPIAIARTGRALNLESDARYRFERHVDPGFIVTAAELATRMILEFCGGEAGALVVAGEPPAATASIQLPLDYIHALSGVPLTEDEVETMLAALGFTYDCGIEGWLVNVPSWRPDVTQKADLVEELLRLKGYDALIEQPLPPAHPSGNENFARPQAVRRVLAGRGLTECYHFAFIEAERAALFARPGNASGIVVVNPINAEQDHLRPSLLPPLLSAAHRNLARGQNDPALFEIGSVFHGLNEAAQPVEAAGLRLGPETPKHWGKASAMADAFDAKADLLAAIAALGIDTAGAQLVPGAPPYFHPGKSGTLRLGPKQVLGWFGTLHPAILRHHDLPGEAVAFEAMLSEAPVTRKKERKALRLSDFPSSMRDFAFVVDADLPAGELLQAVGAAEQQLVQSIRLFDVYSGKGIPEGKKSVAVTVTLQAPDRTLSDADLTRAAETIVAAASRKGAVLRS